MVDNTVRLQLDDLEAEEERIMRELREMDAKAEAEKAANNRLVDQIKEDPEAALSALLFECEKEVRDAKGYIADQGPPLKIVRIKNGETGPRSATYLSRPRNTGVDFTVPVTLKAYTDIIKNPIFLNQIRDRIKAKKYRCIDDYLDDMRLLVRNTAQFNKGPDLAWVVQHARFLLEAAEDAVQTRRHSLQQVEKKLQHTPPKPSRANHGSLSAVGKRKRSQAVDKTNGDTTSVPAVGSAIEIYWHPYRKWYLAYITDRSEGATVHVRYHEDNSEQWVDLNQERWRMRNSRTPASTRSKRASDPVNKRRKSGPVAATPHAEPAILVPGITTEDLDSIKIDLFAKFEDLRESVVEHLKQHLDRVDRAILRSDALTRVLVQLGDTQASVETAVTTLFDKFEKFERRIEGLLVVREKSSKDADTIKEPPAKNLEEEVKEKSNIEREQEKSDVCLADAARSGETGIAPKEHGSVEQNENEGRSLRPVEDAPKQKSEASPNIERSSDGSASARETTEAEAPKAAKGIPQSPAMDAQSKKTSEEDTTKESLEVEDVNEAGKDTNNQNDLKEESGPAKGKSLAEKSSETGAGQKELCADTENVTVLANIVTKNANEDSKPENASDGGESSDSSSGSEDSGDSGSDAEKPQGAEESPATKSGGKEQRIPTSPRFRNGSDVDVQMVDVPASESTTAEKSDKVQGKAGDKDKTSQEDGESSSSKPVAAPMKADSAKSVEVVEADNDSAMNSSAQSEVGEGQGNEE